MNLKNVYLTNLLPQLPKVINDNNVEIQRALDVFYNEALGVIIKPVNTPGRVKAGNGEFVNLVVDNLTVKSQWTNLYDNFTTADYQFYKMYTNDITILRDACTASDNWPLENPSYKYLDIEKPYYKVTNENVIVLNHNNLSQVVGLLFDTSISTTDQYRVLLDPCAGTLYQVDSSMAGSYMEFICTAYDASWGPTWSQYRYGLDEGTIGGSGGAVGPGTINTIAMFDAANSIGDSPLTISGTTLKTYEIDTSSNITIDASIIQYGKEITKYLPNLSPTLAMSETIGGLTVGTTVADLSGMTIENLLSTLIFPTVLAYVYTANSLVLSGLTATTAEVGTSYAPEVTITYNPGVINNGDNTTGPNLTGNSTKHYVYLPNGVLDVSVSTTSNVVTHTCSSYNLILGNNIWQATTEYSDGINAYYDNRSISGTNLDALRVASSISDNSNTVLGRRYAWYGYGNQSTAPIDSAGVRALVSKSFLSASNTGTFDISIPAGTQEVYFFIPAGKTISVLYVQTNVAVEDDFVVTTFNVNDAAGSAVSYDSYVQFIGLTGYLDNATYRVTVS